MALIICKECGAQISDTAALCPQCGFNETPRGQNINSATVVGSEDNNGNESLPEARDKKAGLSAKMLQAWSQFRRGLGSPGIPLNRPSKPTTEEQSESDPAEQQESATLPHSTTLAYRLGRILSLTPQFLKVKRNAYISIGVLCLVVGLIGWWLFSEDCSPIGSGTEAVRVFTHEELCYFLEDNIKSRNDTLQGNVIEVTFETPRGGHYNFSGTHVLDTSPDDVDDVVLHVHVSPSHVDEMLVGRFPEFTWGGSERRDDEVRIQRPSGRSCYGYYEGEIIRRESWDELNEMGVKDYSQGYPIFSIRVRGLCDISSYGRLVHVDLRKCRIENARLTRVDSFMNNGDRDLPP